MVSKLHSSLHQVASCKLSRDRNASDDNEIENKDTENSNLDCEYLFRLSAKCKVVSISREDSCGVLSNDIRHGECDKVTPKQIRCHSKVICFFGAHPHHLLEGFPGYQRSQEADYTKIGGIEPQAADNKLDLSSLERNVR